MSPSPLLPLPADGADGVVELVSPERLHGWLRPRPDGSFPIVEIRLHGRTVRRLRVVRTLEDGTGQFRIPLAESLLRYVPGPGGLRFFVDDIELPVLADELPERPNALGADILEARLAEGYFVTKFGGFRLPLEIDASWQERTFALYAHVRSTMLELFGYDVHAAYGTLLGIVREGAFIDGDDDFDTTFHSRHTSARAVRDELFEIATTLAARGEDVQLSGRKFVHWYHQGAKVDLFPAWTSGENYFQAHVVGGPFADVFAAGYREIEFKGRPLSVPVEAEGALAATYGPGWRTPDPLFQWRLQPEAARAMRALRVTPGQLSLVQWERTWAASAVASTRSPERVASGTSAPVAATPDDRRLPASAAASDFAHLAAHRISPRITGVVDLGCGDGRDTLTVAAGRPALGLDASRAAIAAATSRASESVRFERVDVADAKALRAALGPLATAGPVAVYARRLLECVEKTAEDTVLRVLRRSLQPGSLVIIELKTHPAPEPVLGVPLHREVDPRALVRRWTKGEHFAVELNEHDATADVARIILRRRGPVDRKFRALASRVSKRASRAAARLRRAVGPRR